MGAPYLTLHRATLQRHLAAAVPSERIQLDHRLVGLSDEHAGVRLQFENGNDVVASVVVGADGIHSTARRYVCGDVAPAYSGEIGFRGVIPVGKSQDLPNPASLHCWCGPSTHAVYYGLDRGELVNLLAVYKPHRLPEWARSSNRIPATRDQALSIFENYSWDTRILDLVRNIEGDMSFWALADLPRLPRWSRGRVMLLGDAAHAPLPHQGQGAGQAIEDAYALGALLATGGLGAYGLALESSGLLTSRWTGIQIHRRCSGNTRRTVAVVAPPNWMDSQIPRRRDGATVPAPATPCDRRWCRRPVTNQVTTPQGYGRPSPAQPDCRCARTFG
jgi:salicylate hydroxylase